MRKRFRETAEINGWPCPSIEAGGSSPSSRHGHMPEPMDALPRAARSAAAPVSACTEIFRDGRPLYLVRRPWWTNRGLPRQSRALFLRAFAARFPCRARSRGHAPDRADSNEALIRISHVDGHKHLLQSVAGRCATPWRACYRIVSGSSALRLDRLTRLAGGKTTGRWLRESVGLGRRGALPRARLVRAGASCRSVQARVMQPVQGNGNEFHSLVPDEGPSEVFCHPPVPSGCRFRESRQRRRFDELTSLLPPLFQSCSSVESRTTWLSYWDIRVRILKIFPHAFYSTRGTPLSASHRARDLVAPGMVDNPHLCDRRDAAGPRSGASYSLAGPATFRTKNLVAPGPRA